MSEDRQHRTALVYTIIFFGLVATLSYWYLFQLDQAQPPLQPVGATEVQVDLSELF